MILVAGYYGDKSNGATCALGSKTDRQVSNEWPVVVLDEQHE